MRRLRSFLFTLALLTPTVAHAGLADQDPDGRSLTALVPVWDAVVRALFPYFGI